MDIPESYLESSVTAIYDYRVAKAVNDGCINKLLVTITQRGWDVLSKKVTADGQVPDICNCSLVEENINNNFYRPKELNDTHGPVVFQWPVQKC